jgi:hypothetical protein
MSPPARQSVAQFFNELSTHFTTLYALRKACGLQGEVFLASEQDLEGCSDDKFTVVLESVGLNAI